jgi:hypothetical protein
MDKGIRLRLIWEDTDMLEITFSAWNGEFGGVTKMYLEHGRLIEAASLLEGFPQSPKDERKLKLGDFRPDGFGGAALRLYIKDLAGHPYVEVLLHTEGHAQTVTLNAPFELAALDRFVSEMKKIEDEMDSTALLKTNQ